MGNHNNPPPVYILSHFKTENVQPFYFFNINFSIISLSKIRSLKRIRSHRFSYQNRVLFLFPRCVTCPPWFFWRSPHLGKRYAESLCPAGTRPPRIYWLHKIHKEGVPLRPIVSNIGAPAYQHCCFVGLSVHHVKISVCKTLNSLSIGPDVLMVSLNVVFCPPKCPLLCPWSSSSRILGKISWPYSGKSWQPRSSVSAENLMSRLAVWLWALPCLLSSLTSSWSTLRRGP